MSFEKRRCFSGVFVVYIFLAILIITPNSVSLQTYFILNEEHT